MKIGKNNQVPQGVRKLSLVKSTLTQACITESSFTIHDIHRQHELK